LSWPGKGGCHFQPASQGSRHLFDVGCGVRRGRVWGAGAHGAIHFEKIGARLFRVAAAKSRLSLLHWGNGHAIRDGRSSRPSATCDFSRSAAVELRFHPLNAIRGEIGFPWSEQCVAGNSWREQRSFLQRFNSVVVSLSSTERVSEGGLQCRRHLRTPHREELGGNIAQPHRHLC